MTALYTSSEARQNLASVLEQAAPEGEVRVKQQDGTIFVIRVEPRKGSLLDVEGVSLELKREEIIEFLQEGRRFKTWRFRGDILFHRAMDC